jgi:hypothetical protein
VEGSNSSIATASKSGTIEFERTPFERTNLDHDDLEDKVHEKASNPYTRSARPIDGRFECAEPMLRCQIPKV